MFTTINNQRRSFPELVGQNAHQAAAYVAAKGTFLLHKSFYIIMYFLYNIILGFKPVILRPNDPMTRDLRMDRVRIIVDPTRTFVIKTPIVG
ncbi:unnamed protein product [Rotaria sp. Silwood2]|nr:unnamed protein product [Rotaria sp. Silwood2]CAF4411503.1 unnamed protein product [Rotaria sp. Silwood2]